MSNRYYSPYYYQRVGIRPDPVEFPLPYRDINVYADDTTVDPWEAETTNQGEQNMHSTNEVTVGQIVYLSEGRRRHDSYVYGPGDYPTFRINNPNNDAVPVIIERVFTNTIHATIDGAFLRGGSGYGGTRTTLKLDIHDVVAGPDDKPYVVPEGMLDPNDPRLEWFWDRLSEYAEKRNYCSEYDSIIAQLGLPPRKRTHAVEINVNGVIFNAKAMARTVEEAQEIARNALLGFSQNQGEEAPEA